MITEDTVDNFYEYPKIETLFKRDDNFKVTDRLRFPVYDTIKFWVWTEKIDGTNIRIMLTTEGKMLIGGRTKNADIPKELHQYLIDNFSAEKLKSVFWTDNKPFPVILYGEGYGAKIQKGGGNYNTKQSFRLFDVRVGNKTWYNWVEVCNIAVRLNIKTVPYFGFMTLSEAVEFVRLGFDSIVAQNETGIEYQAEGLVGRTLEPLFDRYGNRLIIKLKTKDF